MGDYTSSFSCADTFPSRGRLPLPALGATFPKGEGFMGGQPLSQKSEIFASSPMRGAKAGRVHMENHNAQIYQKLICDMVQEMTDVRFLRQIYSIIYRQKKRTGN